MAKSLQGVADRHREKGASSLRIVSTWAPGLFSLPIKDQYQRRRQCLGQKYEHASLRATGAPAQECWAVKGRGEKRTDGLHAAIRCAEEEGLGPIPSCVIADGEPNTAGAPQSKNT